MRGCSTKPDGGLNGARLQGFDERSAHPRVIGRIAEHEARGVVFAQRCCAELRREQTRLVGAHGSALIHRDAVRMSGQEPRPVGTSVHGVMHAQCAIVGIRIVDEIGGQMGEVEIPDSLGAEFLAITHVGVSVSTGRPMRITRPRITAIVRAASSAIVTS